MLKKLVLKKSVLKSLFALLGVLSTLVVLAPAASALPAAESALDTPTFLSPRAGEELVGAVRSGFDPPRVVDVELDHGDLNIASGWLFVGSEAGGSDLGRLHLASGTTVRVTDISHSVEEIHLTYIYWVVGSGRWQQVSQSHFVAALPRIGVVGDWPGNFLGADATQEFVISQVPAGVESSWITVSKLLGPRVLAMHMGVRTSMQLTVPSLRGYALLIEYHYKVAGRWYSVEHIGNFSWYE